MTTARALPAYADESISSWDRALYAFLAEKERRSGSHRTVQSYSRMLRDFFGRAHKAPDQITSQEVFAWAHGVGLSGREPSAVTINARIGCASSFFRFAIRMGMIAMNPCDALERPKIHPSPPKGLSADQVRQFLAAIPDTQAGRRDRAIILTLALTGRRRSEVLQLKAGDVRFDEGTPFYTYRGKGGKRGRRELPQPAFDAVVRMLAVPRGCRIPCLGAACASPHGCEATARRWRINRGGRCVPRPLIAGRYDDLPAAVRRAARLRLDRCGAGNRRKLTNLVPLTL